ncbi:MAG: mobile mystery protein B [Desulfobacula sp.]|nr:mobile mystery protein B [Desulfobacula sp.]
MIQVEDGATPLEYDEVKGLKPTHITNKGELDALELENIARASAWMQTVKADKILNTDFICLLHKKMFCDVWKWAGKYRKTEKNIGIQHVNIPVEVHKLCDEAGGWIEHDVYSPDEFAVRFHHRLVFIHPFSNGNGRHARLMADLILEKIFNKEPFTWGKVNLAKTGDVRAMYIKAVKKADDYDYEALLKFVRS